jgi:ubiquinol-cytochrome c reductase iron-sulfur subunit
MSDLRTPPTPEPDNDFVRQAAREDRATRLAAIAFGVAILASLALLVVYVQGGDTQWEGILLFVTFGAVGTGLGIWVRVILGPEHKIVEPRYPMRSGDEDRQAFGSAFEESLGEARSGGRRRFLLRLLGGVGASLGLALTAPLLSFGPVFSHGARNELFVTAWRRGVRLATPEGEEIRAEDVVVDQLVTVFPSGSDNPADAQAVLIGTRPEALDRSTLAAPEGTVEGLVCYSKICTHAGCPVGLYRAAVGELLCPCHQSTFDVNDGAEVLSGPAGRPLPQLPIGVDDEGYLVALGDFTAPVGPSFWNMTQQPEGEA